MEHRDASLRTSAGESGTELETAIPVVTEIATVRKRRVDTGRGVRVTKTVSEREELVDEPLERDELVIERVPIGRILDRGALPVTRKEGDVTIVPVLEEILVTEKRTVLKEEVRITRVRREVREPQRVILRSEEVTAEEFDEDPTKTAPPRERQAEATAGGLAGDLQPME